MRLSIFISLLLFIYCSLFASEAKNIKEIHSKLDGHNKSLEKIKYSWKRNNPFLHSLKKYHAQTSSENYNRARLFFNNNYWVEAYALLTRLPKNFKQNIISQMKASIYYHSGLLKAAQNSFSMKNITKDKKNQENSLLTCVYTRCKTFKLLFNTYIKSQQELDENFLYHLGKTLFQEGHYNLAKLVFYSIPTNTINYFKGRYFSISHQILLKNYTPAILQFKKLLDDVEKFGYKNRLVVKQLKDKIKMAIGESFFHLHKYNVAISWLNKISRKSTSFHEALLEMAWSFYELKQFDPALNILKAMEPPSKPNRNLLDRLMLQAKIYSSQNNILRALETYQEVGFHYNNLRKQLDNVLEYGMDIKDLIHTFTLLAKHRLPEEYMLMLREWIAISDLNELTNLVNLFEQVKSILNDTDKVYVFLNLFGDDLLEKYSFFGNKNEAKSYNEYLKIGKDINIIANDIFDIENQILCSLINVEDCLHIKKLARERIRAFPDIKALALKNDKVAINKLRDFNSILRIEASVYERFKATYKIKNKRLDALQNYKNSYWEAYKTFISMRSWLKQQLLEKLTKEKNTLRALRKIQTTTISIGKALSFKIFYQIKKIYSALFHRLNNYQYQIALEKNDLLWKRKQYFTHMYTAFELKKNLSMEALNQRFHEVYIDKK